VAVPDEVGKRIEIEAPIERVWAALTTSDGLLSWLPTHRAEMELRPGGLPSLAWAGDADEGIVGVVEPPHRLVFRWRPVGRERPYTTVTFTLHDLSGRNELTLVESRFTSLPKRIQRQSWEGNDRGWSEELTELKMALEAA
jgi:uncharacterized protein YndB with AHSA1/START domain